MSNPKNSSLTIGIFIVGALVLIFSALLFFSGGRFFTQKEHVVMYFEGTVQGLQIGAPVKLKGVVLGQITDIQIHFQSGDKKITTPQTIITKVSADLVMEKINRKGINAKEGFFDPAIENGLRAQLNYQSFLTGLLYVELDFYPDSPAKLYGLQTKHRELPTIATGFEELTRTIQEMDLKGIAENVNKFTGQLTEIVDSGEIQNMMSSISRAANAIESTSNNANKQITQLSQNLEKTRGQLDTFLTEVNTQTPEIAESIKTSLNQFNASLDQLNKTTLSINDTFSEDAPLTNELLNVLEDVSRSAQSFRSLSETLDQQPESILRGKHSLPTINSKEK